MGTYYTSTNDNSFGCYEYGLRISFKGIFTTIHL